jgi:hypothetical protein
MSGGQITPVITTTISIAYFLKFYKLVALTTPTLAKKNKIKGN